MQSNERWAQEQKISQKHPNPFETASPFFNAQTTHLVAFV